MADSIWHARSDLDGYFVALFISPAGDEVKARAKAWEIYTSPDHRPEGDGNSDDEVGPHDEPGWTDYHADARGLNITELGDSYIGSDGEGHPEVDCNITAICTEVDPDDPGSTDRPRRTCTLPLGHSLKYVGCTGGQGEHLFKKGLWDRG